MLVVVYVHMYMYTAYCMGFGVLQVGGQTKAARDIYIAITEVFVLWFAITCRVAVPLYMYIIEGVVCINMCILKNA